MADNSDPCVSSTSSKCKRKDKDRPNSRSTDCENLRCGSIERTDSSENSRSLSSDRDGSRSERKAHKSSTSSLLESDEVKVDLDSNSPLHSQQTIPHNTSHWTVDRLNCLRIAVELSEDLTPEKIIKTVFKEDDLEPNKARRFKEYILNHATRGWKNLKNYKCISDVFQRNVDTLRNELTSEDGLMWAIKPMELSDRFLSQRFHVMGEMFGQYLVYMAELHQCGETISEMMYQTLFHYFLQMLGLFCHTSPAIPAKHLKIRSVDVTSKPDMLLLNSQKIIALFQVKRDFGEEVDQPPEKMPRVSCPKEEYKPIERSVYHLDSKIIGQAGGDLLIHSKSSMGQKNRILGIIVQQTYVTFAHLQYEEDIDIGNEIREDDIFLRENHKIEFSKPYNYLDPEMREQLMEPLIVLGLMQNHLLNPD